MPSSFHLLPHYHHFVISLISSMSLLLGNLNDYLKNFLEVNLPKSSAGKKEKKQSKIELGVADEKLAGAIQDALGIVCVKGRTTFELLRGVRQHFSKFIGQLSHSDLEKAQLGLAHSYSRSKVRFNVHKVDNMIIQSINLLDQLDKDINTFAMRVR
jgi:nucleolar protein 56